MAFRTVAGDEAWLGRHLCHQGWFLRAELRTAWAAWGEEQLQDTLSSCRVGKEPWPVVPIKSSWPRIFKPCGQGGLDPPHL